MEPKENSCVGHACNRVMIFVRERPKECKIDGQCINKLRRPLIATKKLVTKHPNMLVDSQLQKSVREFTYSDTLSLDRRSLLFVVINLTQHIDRRVKSCCARSSVRNRSSLGLSHVNFARLHESCLIQVDTSTLDPASPCSESDK